MLGSSLYFYIMTLIHLTIFKKSICWAFLVPFYFFLLVNNQIRNYCDQMDRFVGGGLGKLFLAGGLHKEERF